jgi:hypothetical protein
VGKLTTAIQGAGWSAALVGAGFAVAWLAMGWWLGKKRDAGTAAVPLEPKPAGANL